MSAEIIAGLVALVLALVGGGVGWRQIRKHGQVIEQRDQAEGRADAADKQAERMARPMPNRIERARAVRRRLRARGLSDDEIDAALHRAADGCAAGDPKRPS